MEHARAGLRKVASQVLQSAPSDQIPVLAWPLVCGTAVADRTHALDFNAGVLRITVPDITWRSQLQGLSSEYLSALNRMSGLPVQKLVFVLADGKKDVAKEQT